MLYYIGEVNKIKNGGTKFMKNLNSNNYMDSIYEILDAPEVEYNEDGIEYLDEPEDELFYDDGLSWADDITYLDEPEDEEPILDLGEGFIPLHQGEVYQEELVVIDENYVLDEYEYDIVENVIQPAVEETVQESDDYSFDDIYNIITDNDEINLELDEVESIIQFPVKQTLEEELNIPDISEEDDKIAKAIAKEHMENVKAGEAVGGIFADVEVPEDDTSWVNDDDLFGNDISVIIAEDPNQEVEETDYVEGSFQDWLNNQQQ